MATFTININPDVPYDIKQNSISKEVCGSLALRLPVGLYNTSTTSTDNQYLVENITTTGSLSNLIVHNITYTASLTCYLEYNSVQITTQNTPFTIPLTGITDGDIIPGLEIVINALEGSSNYNINYDIELETSTVSNYPITNGNFVFNLTPCTEPLAPSVTEIGFTEPICGGSEAGSAEYMNIVAEQNTTLKFVLTNVNNGSHGMNGTLSVNGTTIGYVTGTTGHTRDVYYDMNNTSTLMVVLSVCARPPLKVGESNNVAAKVDLMESVTSNVSVGSITVTDNF